LSSRSRPQICGTIPEIGIVPFGPTIPRIIHQTFRSKDVPRDIALNIAHIRNINPGYTYRLYDDADIEAFITSHYGGEVLHQYKRIAPEYGAARADVFRYLLMYKVGGLYLDIKSTVTARLDDALVPGDRFLISQWSQTGPGERFEGWGTNNECAHVPGGEFQQWFIWCAPGHPFLHAVIMAVLRNIEDYRPWRHGVGMWGTLRTFGPRVYTRTIFPLLGQYPYRMVRDETALNLEYSLYGDTTSHARLSPAYYRHNSAPLIRQSACRDLEYLPYICYDRVREIPIVRKIKPVLKTALRRLSIQRGS
jgi:hypothetical protein